MVFEDLEELFDTIERGPLDHINLQDDSDGECNFPDEYCSERIYNYSTGENECPRAYSSRVGCTNLDLGEDF